MFDVIVPAPRFAQRPITQWPTKPSCALFAYPRKTQLDSSPRAFVRGPIADPRTGPPSTWAFAPTHRGPSSRAPARTSAPLSSTTGPFRTSNTTPGSTAASRRAIAAGSPSTALPGGSGSLSPSKARRSSGSSCSSAGTRSYTPRSTTPGTSIAAACGWGPSHVAPGPTPHPTVTPPLVRRKAPFGSVGASPHGAKVGHEGDARLGEPGEVRESEDRSRLHADERLPPLADQVRAGPQLAQGACSDERRPRGGGVRIEQVEDVGHSRCTSSFKRSARPVGITSVLLYDPATT